MDLVTAATLAVSLTVLAIAATQLWLSTHPHVRISRSAPIIPLPHNGGGFQLIVTFLNDGARSTDVRLQASVGGETVFNERNIVLRKTGDPVQRWVRIEERFTLSADYPTATFDLTGPIDVTIAAESGRPLARWRTSERRVKSAADGTSWSYGLPARLWR